MQLACPSCHRTLVYSGERPSFCSYCGVALSRDRGRSTAAVDPEAVTTPPAADPDAPTLAPMPHAPGGTDAVPEVVGGYRLLKQLGSGGMGTVHEAEDAITGQRVALKLISADYCSSRDAVARFRQEGRLASSIAHPRCVFVIAADEDAGRPYIVMELMSGTTLQDVLNKHGPLPPEEAILKILDVIEGLQEAHHQGLVHRDVKPSNCFLEPDGHVKIGDFGLAKSLAASVSLTRTGSFLGTPLFSSPEQVRSEPVDAQSDVYSVAATLYCLLTGRAPFQSNDAAATIARIVSDDPPSMRTLRPELPPGLDRVVLRGLERDRGRRWRDLDEFRTALLPYVSAHLTMGSLGLRAAAYLIDCFLFFPLWLLGYPGVLPVDSDLERLEVYICLGVIPWLVYMTVLEGMHGWSPGKLCLGLRVYTQSAGHLPGLRRGLVRTLVFYGLVGLTPEIIGWGGTPDSEEWNALAAFVAWMLGLAVMACPMRARNGYRGLHELLSGTRVVRLPWGKRRRRILIRGEGVLASPPGMPERVGPYAIKGALRWHGSSGMLVSQDPGLGRSVWLWVRPAAEAPLKAARREASRTTRLRWVAAGRDGPCQWDVFQAPTGCLLSELAQSGRLSWTDLRPLLEQLTDELQKACREETLPRPLSVEQVWVQPNGRVQLLESPVSGSVADWVEPAESDDEDVALGLLRRAVVLSLEGRERPAGRPSLRPSLSVQAPVPVHARKMVDRLLGVTRHPYTALRQVQTDLEATQERPTEVTPTQRGMHLALLSAVLLLPVLGLFMIPRMALASMQFANLMLLAHNVELMQWCQAELEHREHQACLELAVSQWVTAQASPPPLLGIPLLIQWHQDRQLRDRLREAQQQAEARLDTLRQSAGLAWRAMEYLEGQQVAHRTVKKDTAQRPEDAREMATGLLDETSLYHEMLELQSTATAAWFSSFLFGILFVVFSWMTWAFLFRGGFTLPLAGLTLLRSNGAPALRMQCAFRVLLVWLPVVVLLAISVGLDSWWLLIWAGGEGKTGWLVWLSWCVWGLGLAVLLGYVILALRYPTRSLHDRMAGTYLVPS